MSAEGKRGKTSPLFELARVLVRCVCYTAKHELWAELKRRNSSARKSHEPFTEKPSNWHILQIYFAHEKLRFIPLHSSGVFRSLNHSGDVRGCERQLPGGCCRRRNNQ